MDWMCSVLMPVISARRRGWRQEMAQPQMPAVQECALCETQGGTHGRLANCCDDLRFDSCTRIGCYCLLAARGKNRRRGPLDFQSVSRCTISDRTSPGTTLRRFQECQIINPYGFGVFWPTGLVTGPLNGVTNSFSRLLSSPKKYCVTDPARQAYSHWASVGRW